MASSPPLSKTGIRVVSLNLLLENETDPVVWRGPIIAGTVKQFWTDVMWGDVDYMFVDMPPNGRCAPHRLPVPAGGRGHPRHLAQELVEMIVKKARPHGGDDGTCRCWVWWRTCPASSATSAARCMDIFGASHVEEIAKDMGIPVCARLPINPKLAAACDKGMIELFDGTWLDPIVDAICGEDK